MSYQSRIDQLVGEHIAQYQAELMLARKMQACLDQSQPSMPTGYPRSVYQPKALLKTPLATQFILKTGGILSNGVPRVLSADMVNGYLLGVYNPKLH